MGQFLGFIVLLLAVAGLSGLFGYTKGSERYHDLVGEMNIRQDKVITFTQTLVEERVQWRKSDNEFWKGFREGMASQPPVERPPGCDCSTRAELLNSAIDRANSAGRVPTDSKPAIPPPDNLSTRRLPTLVRRESPGDH